MIVRVEGNRATGTLGGLGAGFNGLIRTGPPGQLRGEFRDAAGTGSLLLTLDDEHQHSMECSFTEAARTSRRLGRHEGTALKSGNPSETAEPPRAKTSKLTFQAPQRSVRPGNIFQVPIWVLNGNGLGALNLKLHYDPEVIQPVGDTASEGNLTAGRGQVQSPSGQSTR